MTRRGQDRGYTQEGEEGRVGRRDRPGGGGVRAHRPGRPSGWATSRPSRRGRRSRRARPSRPTRPDGSSWLEDDCRNWRKQRHTCRARLRAAPRGGGLRGQLLHGAALRQAPPGRRWPPSATQGTRPATSELSWLPGECQVDFGEADFRVRGVTTRGHYLCTSFPHSNVGLPRSSGAETSECVCQGLRNVFEFVGGVPRRAVDNATEVGRRAWATGSW